LSAIARRTNRLGHGHLGLEGDLVADAGPVASFAVVGPGGGQIQTPVDQRPPTVGGIGEEDADLAVLRSPGGAGVLPLHPCRPRALLQEARVVHDQDGARVAEVVDHVLTHVVEHFVSVPLDPVQHPVDAVRARVAGFLRQRPAVLPLQRSDQAPQ